MRTLTGDNCPCGLGGCPGPDIQLVQTSRLGPELLPKAAVQWAERAVNPSLKFADELRSGMRCSLAKLCHTVSNKHSAFGCLSTVPVDLADSALSTVFAGPRDRPGRFTSRSSPAPKPKSS